MRVALLAVTDDVASASASERHRRRGVAGDLVVFKVAGAAAEAGYDLDAVEEVAARANDRTRSFGAAFDGCTLPGAEAPLFTLPEGTIAWGLGVHGEPGVGEGELPSADDLAAELVRRVLEDTPDGGGSRVAVLLNGSARSSTRSSSSSGMPCARCWRPRISKSSRPRSASW